MKVLITSGGTKIPIDLVRDITNMSKGTFGSKIASEVLKLGHKVVFFNAKGSKTPFKVTTDFYDDKTHLSDVNIVHSFWDKHKEQYIEYEYSTYDQYAERLKFVMGVEQPDVILLAAAVSDYGIENPVNGKIRSNDMLTLKMKQLPKLIYHVKEWAPTAKLVGFKLLVNSKPTELIEAAQRSIRDNKCDMIVANDLRDIKDNKHIVHLVFPAKETKTYVADGVDSNLLARMVAVHSLNL